MYLFQEEFEYEANDGNVYLVEVQGEKFVEDDDAYVEINTVVVFDESGEVVDSSHLMYTEIVEEARYREYDIEIHERDFDHFGEYA